MATISESVDLAVDSLEFTSTTGELDSFAAHVARVSAAAEHPHPVAD